jgi:SAM-dependent methyltransferase
MGGIAYLKDFYPCLTDRTQETPIDYQYFYQAVWAMTALCQMRPKQHIDVGSDIKFVGMLSTITQVIFVDIRPLQVKLPNFECCSGSITELPFEDNSCESLSSLHVIEHIGLGRYGDLIDPYGAEKACSELKRALSIGGRLYVSIPLGRARVQFNGHRIFATNEVLGLFSGLTLIQAALIDNHGNFLPTFNLDDVKFDEALGQEFALGCFIFQKGEI